MVWNCVVVTRLVIQTHVCESCVWVTQQRNWQRLVRQKPQRAGLRTGSSGEIRRRNGRRQALAAQILFLAVSRLESDCLFIERGRRGTRRSGTVGGTKSDSNQILKRWRRATRNQVLSRPLRQAVTQNTWRWHNIWPTVEEVPAVTT